MVYFKFSYPQNSPALNRPALFQESFGFPQTSAYSDHSDHCAASTDFGTLLRYSWQALSVSSLLKFSHLVWRHTLTLSQKHIFKYKRKTKQMQENKGKKKYHNSKLFPQAFFALVDVLFSNGVRSERIHSEFTTVGP